MLSEQTLQFLEDYQRWHGLASLSAALKAAALALKRLALRQSYVQFAHDYANDPQAQAEAEAWLGFKT